MKIRLGIVSKLVIFLGTFFSLMALGVAVFVYLSQKSLLTEKHLTQAKVLTETYAQSAGDALEVKDDILLISYMDRLKKNPDCRYALILSLDGKVIMHTDSTKLRQKLTDPITLKAIESNETLVQEVYEDEIIYDISSPININFKKVAVMRIGFNARGISNLLDNFREQATLIFIFMVAISVISVFIAGLSISRGFSELNTLVESMLKGKFNEKIRFNRDDEISDIATHIQKAIAETKTICDTYEDKIAAIEKTKHYFINGFAQFFTDGLIVLDDQNKVIYINTLAADIISTTTDVTGKHILEITRSSEIMGLLADSEKQPNTIITATLSSLNTKASICTITDTLGRERVGTIMIFM